MKAFGKRHTVAIGLAALLIAVLAVSPALGGPSLRKLVKKEVAKQLAHKTGPQGATGPQGIPGPIGAITERDGTATSVGAAGTGTATATCNAGEIAIAGGGTMQGIPVTTSIMNSHRNGTTGWTVSGWNGTGSAVNLIPHVVCLAG